MSRKNGQENHCDYPDSVQSVKVKETLILAEGEEIQKHAEPQAGMEQSVIA